MLVISTIDDFIPFSSVSASIFVSEKDNEDEGADPTNAYICEHDSMAEPVPRRISGSILKNVTSDTRTIVMPTWTYHIR